jgi:hypothetical protein
MKVKFLLPAILMLISVTKLFAQPDMKETIDMIKKNLTNNNIRLQLDFLFARRMCNSP